MERTELLNSVREYLEKHGFEAIIIPTQDPHFGEYTQQHFKVREWLSGFTGSAGTLVVTVKGAALWTDSRYFVQAESQLRGSAIHLMKMKIALTPTIEQWLKGQCTYGASVAVDGALFSVNEFEHLSNELEPECRLVAVKDPFSLLWHEREPLVFNPIVTMDSGHCGVASAEKFKMVKSALGMEDGGRYVYYLATCDDIAWLCNIRGSDIEYNPLALSYALVTNSAIHLFVNLDSLTEEARIQLTGDGVEIHPYNSIEEVMGQLTCDMVRMFNPDAISVAHYNIFVRPGCSVKTDTTPGGIVANLKSIKNNWEKEGFRRAFEADAVSWCKILKGIEETIASGAELTEYDVAKMFPAVRSENEYYIGESFETIAAFGPNAALPHYTATEENASKITGNGFLLMDTGAHYSFGGTTDTTRTVPVGKLSYEQKKFYTLVLKGMIDLTLAKFPSGTRGASLDILAREPLYREAVMYYHGTSHGIGHTLCVHEGPQSIRIEENPVTLKPGMIISNEPAIYFDGEYGIRTENVVMVESWKFSKFNEFYCFNTLTLVPIATSCIVKELLSAEEIEWLNAFHSQVYEKISPLLDSEERLWLKKATEAI